MENIISHLSLAMSIHFGKSLSFFCENREEVLGMSCGVCKQTHHQIWLHLLMTSPLPELLLAFLVTCTTTYQYISPVHKLQRKNRLYKVGIKKQLHFPWQQIVCRSVSIQWKTTSIYLNRHLPVRCTCTCIWKWHLYWLLISDSYSYYSKAYFVSQW